LKVFRQPGKKTLQKVRRITKFLSEEVQDHMDMFNGCTPETIAISIIITARTLS